MEENIIMVPGSGTKVIVRDVKQEIETAFLDYSMSVIVARALPDVRDGSSPCIAAFCIRCMSAAMTRSIPTANLPIRSGAVLALTTRTVTLRSMMHGASGTGFQPALSAG